MKHVNGQTDTTCTLFRSFDTLYTKNT